MKSKNSDGIFDDIWQRGMQKDKKIVISKTLFTLHIQNCEWNAVFLFGLNRLHVHIDNFEFRFEWS